MKPSEVIREARNLLFEKGWTQGAYVSEEGHLCSVGAIDAAQIGIAALYPDLRVYGVRGPERYIGLATNCFPVQLWNDHPGRTFDEVVEAFDKAEKLAEAHGQ